MEVEDRFVIGLRYVTDFDLERDKAVNRVDVLLLKLLKEGPTTVTTQPFKQFLFSFDPATATKKQIARCLRDLAKKIEKLSTGNPQEFHTNFTP